jgi:hypothetical protein
LLLGVVAAIVVPAMFGRHGQQAFRVGTVGAAPEGLVSSVIPDAAALGGGARIQVFESAAAARFALDTHALDLGDRGRESCSRAGTEYGSIGSRVCAAGGTGRCGAGAAARRRAAGRTDPERLLGRSRSGAKPDPGQPGQPGQQAIVGLGTIILYLSLGTYGGWVTSGVLEEKSITPGGAA